MKVTHYKDASGRKEGRRNGGKAKRKDREREIEGEKNKWSSCDQFHALASSQISNMDVIVPPLLQC